MAFGFSTVTFGAVLLMLTGSALGIVTDGEEGAADSSRETSPASSLETPKESKRSALMRRQVDVDHDDVAADGELIEPELEEEDLPEDEFVVGDMFDDEVEDGEEELSGLEGKKEVPDELVGSNSSLRDDGAFTFASYWSHYGGNWGAGHWYRRGNLCFVNGLVKVSRRRAFSHPLIGTLDATCRPIQRVIFALNNHQYTTRVDVLTNGEVRASGGQHHHHWLSLTGIQFVASSGTTSSNIKAISLSGGGRWVNYGGSYGSPKYHLDSTTGFCILQGLIKHDGTNTATSGEIGVLPSECRPKKQLIFNACQQDASGRVDVATNGKIYWYTGSFGANKWVSLGGMIIYPSTAYTHTVSFSGGWSNYGGSYGNVEYHDPQVMLCVADGLVRGSYRRRGHSHDVYFGNSAECKPYKSLIFNMNNHAKAYRLDVHTNGWMYWTAEQGSSSNDHGWMSISSVTMPGTGTTR